jgi:four helix bundle protein
MEDGGQRTEAKILRNIVFSGEIYAMSFKFEKLEVYQLALSYLNTIYDIANQLPRSEDFNLKSQITRAATSVVLNIAEGSTAQSDAEQHRFLGMAVRSVLETVACQHIIRRRKFIPDTNVLDKTEEAARILAAKLHAFRNALKGHPYQIKETESPYTTDED